MEMSQVNDHHAPSTPGKLKPEKSPYIHHRLRIHSSLSKLTLWSSFFLAFILFLFILSPPSPSASPRRALGDSWGGSAWEKRVAKSARRTSPSNLAVLVTGAAGFVGTHVSLALKRRGDGVLGLDNFNRYYDPSLKRARQRLLDHAGVFVVDGDLNNAALLRKLFDVVPFTHVMHLAAQAGVRYAMQNPGSYVHSNIAGFVNLLEACKSANPQPAVVWASSSSVYGLNSKVPFLEKDRTSMKVRRSPTTFRRWIRSKSTPLPFRFTPPPTRFHREGCCSGRGGVGWGGRLSEGKMRRGSQDPM